MTALINRHAGYVAVVALLAYVLMPMLAGRS